MGFLSTVPSDANDRMRGAVRTASMKDGNFPGELLCDLALWWVGHEADVELFFLSHQSYVGISTDGTAVIIAD